MDPYNTADALSAVASTGATPGTTAPPLPPASRARDAVPFAVHDRFTIVVDA